jgi:lipopolysaccharide export system protein LptC
MLSAPPRLRTPRQRAAAPEGAIGRRMRMLKWVMPASALLLLAAVTVQTLGASEELSFIVSRDPVGTRHDRLRIDGAVYTGEDDLGRPFRVEAAQARQRSPDSPEIEIEQVRAEINLPDGPATITAPSARYRFDVDRLAVAAPVNAERAGLALSSGALDVDLRAGRARAAGPVTGSTPLGRFEAAGLEADLSGERLVLTGGARLRITRGAVK